ncbi:hypothetical protein HYY75_04325 [bacterium]|nr:hypothetical protein [bacterium]
MLCFLFLLFFLWFLLRKKPDQENNVRQPQADVDFFNLVILQKGLEEAEQMVLLELSRQFRMVPIYSILLQESAFDKLIGKIQQEIALSSSSTNLEEKLELAQKLRKKLFPS